MAGESLAAEDPNPSNYTKLTNKLIIVKDSDFFDLLTWFTYLSNNVVKLNYIDKDLGSI